MQIVGLSQISCADCWFSHAAAHIILFSLQETEKGKFTPTDDYIAHVVVTKDNKNVFLVTDKLVFLIVLNSLNKL